MRIRSKRIEIKMTPEEFERLQERMEETGIQNTTAYLIRMALNGYIIVLDMSEFREILRLMQIAGKNLNQYAKKANETGSIYKEDIEELKRNHKEFLRLMGDALDKFSAIK